MSTRRCLRALTRFLRADDGPTAVEYAVLLALIVCACLASIAALGPAAKSTFQATSSVIGTFGVP
jgi:pilus assembly protein Flp/PilA